ncbi:VolA/Pla-1 family phospholipase [Psychrobium sp. 1_MG-2023]|uniref:VolA/Pla-1 family phospholipase n=1 Tax=Psychrobium sp. 1_MG-2023 TaxID=3062624 RepID=UPI000C33CE1C|nr:VolA/Pla-1 family phospholipase [Psychrobium sp. 1_MG-2023]MDP2560217.1 lipase [Psychrobium sp. 1_MG-2023]PKF57028.1 lipase [Alteromonadales bacterium alter-6D02]
MKKLLLSVAVASALGLTGCSGDSIEDIKKDVEKSGEQSQPLSRIVFDPANAVMAIPNDLLFSGTTDGTINVPSETVAAGQVIDYTDPTTAVGALDGWSTVAPFKIEVSTKDGVSLLAETAEQPGAVRLFKAVLGGPLSPDAECSAQPSVSACKVGEELTFGQDFITTAKGNSIVIVPRKPLAASQGYILAITNLIQDSNNNPIAPSSTYESVRMDVATAPLPLPSQLTLQTLVNSYESGLANAGVDKNDLVYTAAFTTQSSHDVLSTAKALMLVNQPVIEPLVNTMANAGDLLVNAGQIDPMTPQGMAVYTGASRASIYTSTLHAPYYLEKPSADNCQLTNQDSTISATTCSGLYSRFHAMGDSPITVLGALASGALSQESFATQYAAQQAAFGRPDFNGNPALLAGMTFTVQTPVGPVQLDQSRHTTKFNPIPAVQSIEQSPVLVSLPNLDKINALRVASDKELLEMPDSGWPVLIYSHGITSTKETLLSFAGSMAEAGIAVIAIDHPLHGDRAGSVKLPEAMGGIEVPLSASGADGKPEAYLNVASLLTARDNLRQSELDLLALRLAVNKLPELGTAIDPFNVSFLGQSLGSVTGITFTAVANQPVIDPATGQAIPFNPYTIKAASFAAPGGGIAGFLLESPGLGGPIKEGLVASSQFQSLLISTAADQGIDEVTLLAMKDAGAPEYNALVDAVYGPFSQEFAVAAQTLLDSGDPINYATTISQNTDAIHVMEFVGTPGDDTRLPDQVIPNTTVNFMLSGTEPLVENMNLDPINSSVMGENGAQVAGVVRFTDGHHSSLLTNSTLYGGSSVDANTVVLTEIHTQLASFIASGGTMIKVTSNSPVIK